ncbi:polyphosphate kinase 2 family protein [Rhodocista pekingensis]|uniref:Polyphosphate kinase 2 family protein n=1 Tax=Rhodocista pekingensis TaxID=201185 RepID=A0ABW2KYH8_9PROT
MALEIPDRFRLDRLPERQPRFADKADYEDKQRALQQRMARIQFSYFWQELRAVIVFEGWDAAGKGGAIRRMTAELDPRGFHVWPIAAPTADEQGRHYLWRFWQRLPTPGSVAIFDRSWYGRVLVERVEGLAKRPDWTRAYDEINAFEKMLTDDGIRVIKLFLSISPEEQAKRLRERLEKPWKRWKLTPDDLRARARWDEYVEAAQEMFVRTSTPAAPWTLIPANSKWCARVDILRTVADALAEGVPIDPPPLDPGFARLAQEALGGKG